MDSLKELIILILIFIFIVVFLIFSIQIITISFFDNIPSVVKVDKDIVYKGSSAGFSSESNGYATKVVIYGGFLYFFPQKVYVSKDVVIEGSK